MININQQCDIYQNIVITEWLVIFPTHNQLPANNYSRLLGVLSHFDIVQFHELEYSLFRDIENDLGRGRLKQRCESKYTSIMVQGTLP